jgi:hypothetical protein
MLNFIAYSARAVAPIGNSTSALTSILTGFNWREQGKALTEGCSSLVFQSSGCVVSYPDKTAFLGITSG